MKSYAITDDMEIELLNKTIDNIRTVSKSGYFELILIYEYGLKQADINDLRVCDLKNCPISDKYPDVEFDTVKYLPYITEDIGCFANLNEARLETILPNRDYLYKLLNGSAKESGLSYKLSVSIIHKTWAYKALVSGENIQLVMKHFSYEKGIFLFLTDFLGLSPKVCMSSETLLFYYLSACFKEISNHDFSSYSPEDLDLVRTHTVSILDILWSGE